MAASSFTSVSLDPALVSICLKSTSQTLHRLRGVERVGISVLARDQDAACLALSGHGERFDRLDWNATANGAVLINGAVAWMECSVYGELPAGDHSIVLLQLHAVRTDQDEEPLVFHRSRFRQLTAVGSEAA